MTSLLKDARRMTFADLHAPRRTTAATRPVLQPAVAGAEASPAGMSTEGYTITQVAAALGLTVRALRHYEHKGLVRPARSRGGERRYSADQLERLRMVALLRGAGVSIPEILEAHALPASRRQARFHELVQVRATLLQAEVERLAAALCALAAPASLVPVPAAPVSDLPASARPGRAA